MAVCIGFGRFSVGLLLPAMKEGLDLTYAGAGLLASVNLAAYCAGVLAMFRLGARVAHTTLLAWGLGIALVGLATLALPVGVAGALVALTLTGLAGALGWISAAAVGTALGSVGRRGRVLGLIGGALGFGLLIASGLTLALVNEPGHGWRLVWATQAVLAAGALALALIVRPAIPRAAGTARRRRAPAGLTGLRIAYGTFGIGYALFTTYFIASISAHGDGGPPEAANWAVVGCGAVVGAFAYGAWSDRWGRRQVLIVAHLVGALGCLAVIGDGWGVPGAAVVAGLLFGTLMTGMASLVPAALADVLPVEVVPEAFASLTLVFGVVQAVAPLAGGVVVDHAGGFPVVFALAALSLLVAAAVFAHCVRPGQADGAHRAPSVEAGARQVPK